MFISDVAIFVRGIYRVVELAQGWKGYLITHEAYFYGFDTALMIITLSVWIIGQPGFTLGKEIATLRIQDGKEFVLANPGSVENFDVEGAGSRA
jgi:hypothetical protein